MPRSDAKPLYVLGGLFLGILLTIVLAAAVPSRSGLFHWIDALGSSRFRINVDQATVIRQIRQLQRLETVSYTMDKIIGGEHQNVYLPKFLAGDRILLVVHGDVVAGVDLEKLQPRDVTVHGASISIHLPAAEVLSTRIDNTKTRVYSRDTGLFSSPDPNLETEVRQEAERQLLQAALQDGILKSADQNARSTITSLLRGFGFSQIEVS